VCAGHWRGSKKGAGRVGASWPRNPATCVSVHAPVHGERGGGGTDREGPRHRERRKGCAGQRLGDWRTRSARQRERARGRRKLAPTGWPHWVVRHLPMGVQDLHVCEPDPWNGIRTPCMGSHGSRTEHTRALIRTQARVRCRHVSRPDLVGESRLEGGGE
jgi:hypothetical protein